jgi:uncharacterized protein YjbJ (UPF0337 family)
MLTGSGFAVTPLRCDAAPQAINGKRDQLEGKIQERYGLAKDQVRKDVDDWYGSQTW